MKRYPAGDCVICPPGRGWPDDNARSRGDPENFGCNALAYIDRQSKPRSRVFVIGKRSLYWVDNRDLKSFDPFQTGDAFPDKICLTCGIVKPTGDFPKNQTAKGGRIVRRPRCKQCFDNDSGAKMKPEVRDRYHKKHAPANGEPWQCPICEKISIAGVNVKIVVDHDQESGEPRGLLCESCNTGLGRFKNGEDHLRNAIAYLQGRSGDG